MSWLLVLTILTVSPRTDDEATIKVASTKKSVTPSRPARFGKIKLKKAPPKQIKPGNWKEGNIIEGAQSRLRPGLCTDRIPKDGY